MSKGLKIFLSIILVLLLIAIITLTTLKILNKQDKAPEPESPYSTKAIAAMEELHLLDDINNKEYSKTIEVLLETNNLRKEYLEEYFDIDYEEIYNFPNIINKLLDKNYTSEEINYITKNIKDDITILLNMDYVNILAFKDISNFDISNIERYLAYQEENQDYENAGI